jgi:hypothetical protein
MSATHNNTGRAKKTSGDIHATPGATTTRVFCKNTISEQFAARTIKILELPAFRVLSLSKLIAKVLRTELPAFLRRVQ